LSSASFADPFSFLGPYLQEEGIALRVWMPGADGVAVELASGERLAMVRDEASGFVLKSDLDLRFTHYQLAVAWNGTEQMLDDPY
ncbi:GlgB N-terminal domain-containing protein, partial [Vibrio alfacsensis]|uniref:GlgB N-terminal domain-containing protein n=1 Tax=Vibrio alfacsensis TaxID=1074311 RepID=UPI004068748E